MRHKSGCEARGSPGFFTATFLPVPVYSRIAGIVGEVLPSAVNSRPSAKHNSHDLVNYVNIGIIGVPCFLIDQPVHKRT